MNTLKDWFFKFLHDHAMNPVDITAGGIGVASLLKWLPEISAGLSAVWVLLRIVVLIRDEFIRKGKQDGNK